MSIQSTEQADFATEMGEAFRQFGKMANFGRSIPDVRDGLKPVHRRILWSMWQNKERHMDARVKSAKAVGEIMGNYHPHGDTAIYGAINKLAQPFANLVPLIDPQGNWGSVDDPEPAAPRYTECRMTIAASVALGYLPGQPNISIEVDEDTVEMGPNYSGLLQEPAVLPSLMPTLVINGVDGIGLGVAVSSPGHNLKEVMQVAYKLVGNPDMTTDAIMKIMPGPESPSNCDIYDTDAGEIRQYLETGIGSYIMRARYHVESYDIGSGKKVRQGNKIIVTGLPGGVSPEGVLEGIGSMLEKKLLPYGIKPLNATDNDGLRVEIDIQEYDPEEIIQRLLHYSASGFQTREGVFLNAVVDGYIQTIGIIPAIKHWINHRRKVVRKRSRFRLNKARTRMHMVDGFIKAVALAEEIIVVVRASKNKAEASTEMQNRWGFSVEQADAIIDMTIGQLTRTGVERYENERDALQLVIDDSQGLLNSADLLDDRIKEEIKTVSKELGRSRQSNVVEGSAYVPRPTTPAVEEPTINGYLAQTGRGWIRWVQSSRINFQLESDHVTSLSSVTNKDYVDCITDWGYHTRVSMDKIPKNMTNGKGVFSFALDASENPILIGSGSPYGENASIVIISESGLFKKIGSNVWDTVRQNKSYQIFSDEMVSKAIFLPEGKDLMVISKYGRALKIRDEDIPTKGRGARGIPLIKLESTGEEIVNGEGVAWLGAVDNDDTIAYWTDENMLGSFNVADVRYAKRGTKGNIVTQSEHYIQDAVVSSEQSVSWFHGTMKEPRTVEIESNSTSLKDSDLTKAPGINSASAIWAPSA